MKIDEHKFTILLRKGWRQTDAARVFGCKSCTGHGAWARIKKKRNMVNPLLKKIISLAGSTRLCEEQLFEMVDLYYHMENLNKNGDAKERIP